MRDYEFYYTQDGSIGLYSYADDDVYHSKFGALTEAWDKFILPSGLDKLLNKQDQIRVLDVCYGIGYNTKALMSYIINSNENILKLKNKKNFYKKIKKFLPKIFQKKFEIKYNIESSDTNKNFTQNNKILSPSIDSISGDNIGVVSDNHITQNYDENFLSEIKIDCLEINEELVKISPLLKTVITPQEVFSRIIPHCFDCFESYWKIKKFLAKFALFFAPKNKKNITELLDLKFNNDYDILEKNFRIHKFVNYMLINNLVDKYGEKYLDKNLKEILRERKNGRFYDRPMINYAKFRQNKGYKLLSKFNLGAFLHNIYYDHLSNRYKRAHFKDIESLFKLSFYVNDARKSILDISGQYDLIFLDAFTFSKAPELWSVEFMAELYRRLAPTGILMTYSNSALVRNTFLENNFFIGKIIDDKTGKTIGTVAAKEKSMIEHPLSNYEMGLCSTRAGIPYHDYSLNSERDVILKRREQDFKSSDLMTSSQYMRSRMSKTGDNDE